MIPPPDHKLPASSVRQKPPVSRKSGLRGALASGTILVLVLIGLVHGAMESPKVVRVGIYRNPPKVFLDAEGRPAGIFPDVLGEIAQREGWSLEYVQGDWDACLRALEEGQIDLMPDVAFTRERDARFDFHGVSVVDSWSQLFAGRSDLARSLADLEGKRISVLTGSVQRQDFQRMLDGFGIHATLVDVPDYEQGFRSVRDGTVDFAIANHLVGEFFLAKYRLYRTPVVFQPVGLFFATAEGRGGDLLQAIDHHLEEGRRTPDSYYYKTFSRWLGSAPRSVIPRYLLWVLGVVVAGLCVAGLVILVLRLQVRVKTKRLLEADGSLRESERRYRMLFQELSQVFETMPEALVRVDAQRRIVDVNPAFRRIFGYELQELRGESSRVLYAREADFLEQGSVRFGGDAPPTDAPVEILYLRKDGTRFRGETVGALLRSETGETTGALALTRDVTEIRRLEERLAQSQKLDSVGRLAGGVAHDFNNLLGVVFGYVELALERLPSPDPLRSDLEAIHSAAERSAELVRQLLAFSRQQAIVPRTVDLNASVGALAKLLGRLLGGGIELAWRPGPDLWNVRIDPSQLDQILANLCVNARDAVGDQGRITIWTENASIQEGGPAVPGGPEAGQYVLLGVEDDGCGMDPVTMGRVFEPFFTTKEPGAGTGLGLATVYGIVHQNGGFIDVSSKPGKGAVFRIYLPRLGEAPTPDSQEAASGLQRGSGELVLVVDDDRALLSAMAKMLQELGYEPLEAGDPAEAVRLADLHGEAIRLVLLDLVLPGMNGRDLAELLQARLPAVRYLFVSGYPLEKLSRMQDSRSRDSFLPKPVRLAALAARVRAVLDAES